MKRIRRIFLRILTTLSLLVCIASAAFWIRSYWVGDEFRFSHWDSKPDLLHEAHEVGASFLTGRGQFAVEIRSQRVWWVKGRTVFPAFESWWQRQQPPLSPEVGPFDTFARQLRFGHWQNHRPE